MMVDNAAMVSGPLRSSRRRPGSSHAPGAVRIIGGRWRGTRLQVPDLPGLRPTADRARETLFNWLQPVLPGARVLDLFAGSGALGLEALSRGAAQALLVERDAGLVRALEGSVARLGAQAEVVHADALAFLHAPLHGHFDIVFVDPPFQAGLWPQVLDLLGPWLAPGAWLYLESPPDAEINPGAGWMLHREHGSRHARHALFRMAP